MIVTSLFNNFVIELCPTSELNYGNRAACYIMMERYEDGLADAKRSVELNSTFVRVCTYALLLFFF